MSSIIRFFRKPCLTDAQLRQILLELKKENLETDVLEIDSETCYNVEITKALDPDQKKRLKWILSETFEQENFGESPFLSASADDPTQWLFEVGPRLNFATAWSTNAVSICEHCGLDMVIRVERSKRLLVKTGTDASVLTKDFKAAFLAHVHDRMTQCVYEKPIESFKLDIQPESWLEVDVLGKGRQALVDISRQMGLGYDEQDLDYYTRLFVEDLKRNPTSVECFDLAQGNSEHSRHWFFNGKIVIDGVDMPETLFSMVKKPVKLNPRNSTVAFKDNSSAQKGFSFKAFQAGGEQVGNAKVYGLIEKEYDLTLTAETHNFPCGVAPFPGAETGTGGRLRDGMATGKGSLVVAGTAAYCVGQLHIPGYDQPWEDASWRYPPNMASPLKILIEASNGASDYGNKFGEPIIQGYVRSFGANIPLRLSGGQSADGVERREWVKPIMFTGGVGMMDARHRKKEEPAPNDLIVKLGGPAYRIGMGGGAASSMVAGDNQADLDFNAVQRGDAEMCQKAWRVIRTCAELGDANPIVSIHDQGAGGAGNVLKEITEPQGGVINLRDIASADPTLSVVEIWGAEYQESWGLLLKPSSVGVFKEICDRERCEYRVVGHTTGNGIVEVRDSKDGSVPVNLPLEKVLGKMPQKVFKSTAGAWAKLKALTSPSSPVLTLSSLSGEKDLSVASAFQRVIRLASVASKRYLTTKVDRSVTGLIAQQQCVGPLQLTLADVAVVAMSEFSLTGTAISIGEQPIKGLVDPATMARVCIAESLTNLVWAQATAIEDIKASLNWMYAAKLDSEGAAMYKAMEAFSAFLSEIGAAVDGGKDSLSMAARVAPVPGSGADGQTVKAPGEMTLSCYVSCPDVTKTVTPDLKLQEEGVLIFVPLDRGQNPLAALDLLRAGAGLAGSAFAQVYGKVAVVLDETAAGAAEIDALGLVPDASPPADFKAMWEVTQGFLETRTIAAGHDRSDGGLITCLMEMAFAGNQGIDIVIEPRPGVFPPNPLIGLFSEGPGIVLEVEKADADSVAGAFHAKGLEALRIGTGRADKTAKISYGGRVVLEGSVATFRDAWEQTSFELDRLQANPECVATEQAALSGRPSDPKVQVSFDYSATPETVLSSGEKVRVAIVREEGSNGDREMAAAFHLAGFAAYDVTMSDLINEKTSLSDFRGVVFVGGFSYADVCDSAKGWAASIRFNPKIRDSFSHFASRSDTFSLGVCNGCQLMALLGWVPGGYEEPEEGKDSMQPRFVWNESGRFESRWSCLEIQKTKAIMLRGMEGAVLPVWSAHGEGKAFFPEGSSAISKLKKSQQISFCYVDDYGQVTQKYPFNPNGSEGGVAGMCSADGRHLCLMPHPERCVLPWQWPHVPNEVLSKDRRMRVKRQKGADGKVTSGRAQSLDAWYASGVTPWIRMFQNAREWCESH